MTVEGAPGLPKEIIQAVNDERNTIVAMITGPGPLAELITPENFPHISQHAPKAFAALQKWGTQNFENDQLRQGVLDNFPEMRVWPNGEEQSVFVTAALLGKGDEALEKLKEDHAKRLATRTQAGFAKTQG